MNLCPADPEQQKQGVFACTRCGFTCAVKRFPVRNCPGLMVGLRKRGLGDLIHDGVKWAVGRRLLPRRVMECKGCARRRKALNRLTDG